MCDAAWLRFKLEVVGENWLKRRKVPLCRMSRQVKGLDAADSDAIPWLVAKLAEICIRKIMSPVSCVSNEME